MRLAAVPPLITAFLYLATGIFVLRQLRPLDGTGSPVRADTTMPIETRQPGGGLTTAPEREAPQVKFT